LFVGCLGGVLVVRFDELGCGFTYFVDHAVPSVAGVVDDDVDFAVAEVCGLLDEGVQVFVVEHVSWSGDGLAAGLVDGVCHALCFVCWRVSVRM
jgi:hypothetical protein